MDYRIHLLTIDAFIRRAMAPRSVVNDDVLLPRLNLRLFYVCLLRIIESSFRIIVVNEGGILRRKESLFLLLSLSPFLHKIETRDVIVISTVTLSYLYRDNI